MKGGMFSCTRWWGMVIKELLQLRRDRLTFAMIVGIPIVQLLLFGYACFRHRATAAEMAAAPKVNAAFAQGDIAQRVKWSAEMRRETAARYLRLSRGLAADAGAPDLVVWPETALPFSPANDELMRPVAVAVWSNEVWTRPSPSRRRSSASM